MQLMLKDKAVMNVNIDENVYEVLEPGLVPFPLRGTIKRLDEKSPEELQKLLSHPEEYERYTKMRDNIRDKNKEFFLNYLAHRTLSLSGKNHKKLLNTLDLDQGRTDYERAKIAIYCKGTSMEDNYWLKPDGSELKWEDVDLKTNSLSEVVAQITLHGKSLTIQGTPRTPELANKGTYAQAWKREDGKNFLYKKSTKDGNESEIEVSVSRILDCFNVPHVKYLPASDDESSDMCKCENMATEDLNVVTSTDVGLYCSRHGKDPVQFMLDIDSENIYKMCIVDYMVSNSERHSGNWGFYMSSDTGSLLCCHPLFDHNNAFDKGDMEALDGGPSKVFKGKNKREAANMAIKRCKFECIAPVTRDMFPGKEEYESFMKRACELGLYRRQKTGLIDRLGLRHEEQYVPVNITNISFPHPNGV